MIFVKYNFSKFHEYYWKMDNTFVNKNNPKCFKNYGSNEFDFLPNLNWLFSHDECKCSNLLQQYEDVEGIINGFKRDHLEHAMEFQHFFTEELPNYFFKVGKDVGVNFTEENKQKFLGAMKSSLKLSSQKNPSLSEQYKLDAPAMMPRNSSNLTTQHAKE